jgi:hypothetical protein
MKEVRELLKGIIENYKVDVARGAFKSSQDYQVGVRTGRHEAADIAQKALALLSEDKPCPQGKPVCKTCNDTGEVPEKSSGCNCTYCSNRLDGCQIKIPCPDCKSQPTCHQVIDYGKPHYGRRYLTIQDVEHQPKKVSEPTGEVAESKKFPLLGGQSNIGSIPWWIAEQAYIGYASKYGDQQSLERLAERGGFGIEEMDEYYPKWREECSLIQQLQAERDSFETLYSTATKALNSHLELVEAQQGEIEKLKLDYDEQVSICSKCGEQALKGGD